ncbi:MAG: DUF4357 domain-containing protein [Chlorobia bacterium]|nr:DUF4357 domain-containing protein [Fimbriimonadaceae bacterium]
MSDPEQIRTALTEARRYLGELPAPPNEANTCDWVIRPLLVALGYANHEIHAQASDVSNRFPDYTVLPDTDHTWYLEAKTWKAALESQHVDQSMNYAHSNGRRWVVLTNGQEWRLYDDRIQGKSADRLVATARLDDEPGMTRFLEALSRDSIVTARVDSYASERRVREYLVNAIADASSPVIEAVLKAIRVNLSNVPVTAEAVVSILNAAQSGPVFEPIPDLKPGIPQRIDRELVFSCKAKDADARGLFNGEGITVLPGSRIRRYPVASMKKRHERETAKYLSAGKIIDREHHFEVVQEIPFRSPSAASNFVWGSASNGWRRWVGADGRPLKDYHLKKGKGPL